MFRILDDQCKNPFVKVDAEIDQKTLQVATTTYASHAHFSSLKSSKTTSPGIASFTIRHYAGEVSYEVGKLGETNKDSLKSDLVSLIKTSKLNMISTVLYNNVVVDDKQGSVTSATRIRSQCQSLVDTLMLCAPHYVRCVKSNDNKQALTIDVQRVKHQIKYLGLQENIRVRRAGFAYRCEYNRFLDRFYFLSSQTYPDWKGSDADGCRAIINSIKSSIPSIVNGEIQFGKSIIFIRRPETFNAISKLRKIKINDIPIPIQRAWRRYLLKVEVNKLPVIMSELFSSNRKARNRTSIFRDYSSSYLDSLGHERAEIVKKGIFRIVDYYNKSESVKFIDQESVEIIKSNLSPFFKKESRILVLTTAAIYIMEILTDDQRKKIHATKNIPEVILRRRIGLKQSNNNNNNNEEIKISEGILENIQVSTLADGCLCIKMKPVTKIIDPHENLTILHPNWPKKEEISVCQITKEPFSMISDRKFRCKVSGQVVRQSVCDTMQYNPDYGYYEPKRVVDGLYGVMSQDQVEDILIASVKKTEFLGLLLCEWENIYKTKNIIEYVASNTFNLRSGPEILISKIVASEICLQADSNIIDDTALLCSFNNLEERNKLLIRVCEGISDSIVEKRKKRQMEKAALAVIDRKKKDQERQIRNKQREADAEKNRLLRNKEKQAANAVRRAEIAKVRMCTYIYYIYTYIVRVNLC